jgi:hypothetical protein
MSKAKSFGMQQVQFVVSSAICEFNSRAKFHTSLLELMNVSPGTSTTLYLRNWTGNVSTMLRERVERSLRDIENSYVSNARE